MAKKITAKALLKRADAAFTKKDEWRSLLEDCYEFCLPNRNLYDGYYEGRVEGHKKMNRVFDSTAITSTQRFANRMQAGIFPSNSRWCRLEPGDEIPEKVRPKARNVLEVYTERMFTAMRQSNFDIAIGEFLLDLSVGTGVMLVQPGFRNTPVTYTPVPQYCVAIEEGPGGMVDNVYRKMRVKAEAIMAQWPDAKLTAELERCVKEKPEESVDFIEATCYNYDDHQWYYYVIKRSGENTTSDGDYIVQRKKNYSPWVVARYMKVAGETYGRGPVITALPDVKTLNKTLELLLKNASIAVAGVYTGMDDGVLNPQTVRITPGAIIPVARNGGPQGPSLQPLKAGTQLDLTQIIINDLRMSVKKALLDESLPPDGQAPRSATEIVERMKELSQNLGSAFGRLIDETMIPIVAKTLAVLDERGVIDMPLKVNGREVKVIPVSPLAMAQNADDIQALMEAAQISAMLDQLPQTHVDLDMAKDYVLDKRGVPMSIRLDAEQRKRVAEEQAAQQQDNVATAAAAAGAEMVGGEAA